MIEVLIREAQPADIDAVLALERATTGAPHWTRDDYLRMAESGGSGALRRGLLIAERGGVIVGFAAGVVIGRGEDAIGELESVVVAEGWRRHGVGRRLCEGVMAWCADCGGSTVQLEVRASSEGARVLYRGLGFVEAGRRPGYYREPVEDAVLMRKDVRRA